MKEFPGYTISTIESDARKHPMLMGELIAFLKVMGKQRMKQDGKMTLSKEDSLDPKKRKEWEQSRGPHVVREAQSAENFMRSKHPELMGKW